mmetsp:Transcript_15923/g.49763  ORF Transcript_15923/g.49763 Transcript_15923/m.49763 type:complete len:262 (+) Transcript_15923:470-1255(+)
MSKVPCESNPLCSVKKMSRSVPSSVCSLISFATCVICSPRRLSGKLVSSVVSSRTAPIDSDSSKAATMRAVYTSPKWELLPVSVMFAMYSSRSSYRTNRLMPSRRSTKIGALAPSTIFLAPEMLYIWLRIAVPEAGAVRASMRRPNIPFAATSCGAMLCRDRCIELCAYKDGGSSLLTPLFLCTSSLLTGSTRVPMFARKAASPPLYKDASVGMAGLTPNRSQGCPGVAIGVKSAFGTAPLSRTVAYSLYRSLPTFAVHPS